MFFTVVSLALAAFLILLSAFFIGPLLGTIIIESWPDWKEIFIEAWSDWKKILKGRSPF